MLKNPLIIVKKNRSHTKNSPYSINTISIGYWGITFI